MRRFRLSWLLCASVLGICLALAAAESPAAVYNLHLVDRQPAGLHRPGVVRPFGDRRLADARGEVHRRLAVGPPQPAADELRGRGRADDLGPDPALQLLRRAELRHRLLAEHAPPSGNSAYRGRYIQLGDHTVSEVSWDNGQTLAPLRFLDERLLLQPRRARSPVARRSRRPTPASSRAARASRGTTTSTTSPRSAARTSAPTAGGAPGTIRSSSTRTLFNGADRTQTISRSTATVPIGAGSATATC